MPSFYPHLFKCCLLNPSELLPSSWLSRHASIIVVVVTVVVVVVVVVVIVVVVIIIIIMQLLISYFK